MTKIRSCSLWAVLLIGLAVLPSHSQHAQPATVFAKIDIHEIGPQRLESIRSNDAVAWWVELDSWLLVATSESDLPRLERMGRVQVLDVAPREHRLRFLRRAHGRLHGPGDYDGLARGGRYEVVQLRGEQPSADALELLPL